MVHASFEAWARDKDGRPDFWVGNGVGVNGPVYELSEHLRTNLRIIMFKVQQCVMPGRRTYAYSELEDAVRIGEDKKAFLRNPRDREIKDVFGYRDIFKALSNLVKCILAADPPPNGVDIEVVSGFLTLCGQAKSNNNFEENGFYAYFITMHPIIYSSDEWYSFVDKTWFYWNADITAFQRSVTLQKFKCYHPAVQNEKDNLNNCFVDVYEYKGGCRGKHQLVKYVGNLRRHFDKKETQQSMILHIRRVLPGYATVLYLDMIENCCMKPNKIPTDVFGSERERGIENSRSFISCIMGEPHIIRPNDWHLVESKIPAIPAVIGN